MTERKNLSVFDRMKALFGLGAPAQPQINNQHDISNEECCQGKVHIAYRGVSDDRLYLAENRSASEVKFFRPNGLRVFCAGCRKRLQ